ncbi:MATE family efflux transporter [Anaerovorax odorimutans]|uniref:Multidrug export protein MepA n=1 Tax=Anaerovorax odorimutans TaxID=109327 RepID=A0ABT1RJ22_9FIRM|nr:MATE family efflux transporter [Anaerovorax odorimutans]MCQ4635178.1 MATE family efflux transporter [Anaerovorax odorimutans]
MKKKMSLADYNAMPVRKAVTHNAVPAMFTMLMVLVYNLADTLFIGLTHDAYQVAAISLATPLFMMYSACSNIFGMGGTSVIARAMGQQKGDYAKKVCSFCMWTATAVGIIFAILFFVFAKPILTVLGASRDTLSLANSYLTIVAFAGPLAMISGTFSKILTAEGQPKKAMMGSMIGNILNIILDPIMILGFHWNIAGAAIATLISNMVAAGYYLLYFVRGNSSLSIKVRDYTLKGKVCSGVLAIGIPAGLGSMVMGVSVMFINNLMAGYGDMALAGSGVATKITMITGMLCIGVGQGVQPLLGFSIGEKNQKRFKETFRFSLIFAFIVGLIMTGICYLFLEQIVGVFLTDVNAYQYAFGFGKILLTTSSLFGIFYVLQNSIQAMGMGFAALIVNISRQGLIYIPLLYVFNHILGVNGLIWAQPVADVLALLLAAVFVFISYRKLFCKVDMVSAEACI